MRNGFSDKEVAVSGEAGPDASEPACLRQDPRLWDIDHAVHRSQMDWCRICDRAVRICAGCPVRDWCGAVARDNRDVYTIRGGWARVRATDEQTVPARRCGWCALPVLRGGRHAHCSTLCASWVLTPRPCTPGGLIANPLETGGTSCQGSGRSPVLRP
jgi:hypothetical protein